MGGDKAFHCERMLDLLHVPHLRYILRSCGEQLEQNVLRPILLEKIKKIINDKNPFSAEAILEIIDYICRRPTDKSTIYSLYGYYSSNNNAVNIQPNNILMQSTSENIPYNHLNNQTLIEAPKNSDLSPLVDFLIQYVLLETTKILVYPSRTNHIIHQGHLYFTFSDKCQDIINSRQFRNHVVISYDLNVFLRVGTYSRNNEYQDQFPRNFNVKINERSVYNASNKYMYNQNGILPITKFCFLHPSIPNIIDISFSRTNPKFFATVFIGKKRPFTEISNVIKNRPFLSRDFNLIIIKRQLINSNDIQTDAYLDVSLRCPISQGRMEFPARFSTCNHIQCFDLYSFLFMNSSGILSACPICEIRGTINILQIDSFMLELCQKFDYNRKVRVKTDLSYTLLESEVVNIENVIDDCTSNANPSPIKIEDVEVTSVHTDLDIDVIFIDK